MKTYIWFALIPLLLSSAMSYAECRTDNWGNRIDCDNNSSRYNRDRDNRSYEQKKQEYIINQRGMYQQELINQQGARMQYELEKQRLGQ